MSDLRQDIFLQRLLQVQFYVYYNHIPVSSVECSALLMDYIWRSAFRPSIDDDRWYMVAKSNVDKLSIDLLKADIRDINCDHIGRHLQSITDTLAIKIDSRCKHIRRKTEIG